MHMDALVFSFLEPIELQSLLLIGPGPWRAVSEYCEEHGIRWQHSDINQPLPHSERFDLSVVYDFETVEKAEVRNKLGLSKNLISARIWAVTPEVSQWSLRDFVELGFVEDRLAPQVAAHSYSYNLESYNRRRDWNNPRFWANPQRWDIRF